MELSWRHRSFVLEIPILYKNIAFFLLNRLQQLYILPQVFQLQNEYHNVINIFFSMKEQNHSDLLCTQKLSQYEKIFLLIEIKKYKTFHN